MSFQAKNLSEIMFFFYEKPSLNIDELLTWCGIWILSRVAIKFDYSNMIS